ncbi:MAG: SMC-Scp complex subunit ScpB [Planctomycetota bacterium]
MAESDSTEPPKAKRKRARFSLENLSDAFARLTGTQATAPSTTEVAETLDELSAPSDSLSLETLSPRMIVEGMLFVGQSEGQPIGSADIASHIRDVSPQDVDKLIDELNEDYRKWRAPYRIESVGVGYRFELDTRFDAVRQRFHGRIREAKLTPPALEVLSVVAYRQPIAADEVGKLRGNRSHALLNQLVRRGLLRLDRPSDAPRRPLYWTTDRFNSLFRIGSPQDLPSSEDLDDC